MRRWHWRCSFPGHQPGSASPTLLPGSKVSRGHKNGIRTFLLARGTVPAIPNNHRRTLHHPFSRSSYRKRNLIERAFCRLKYFRRIAARSDRRADVFLNAIYFAAIVTWWV
jgi:putative transposase